VNTGADVNDVLFRLAEGVGHIRLNRPQTINALTLGMFHALEDQLSAWFEAGSITALDLSGEGARGYCAGADVRQLRQLVLSDPAAAVGFLDDEYRLDRLIAHSPVPLTVHCQGLTMGGGNGLGLRAARRLGDPDTRWAMPEVGIGLWPDVGVCYALARRPGQLGVHLALTGATIDGASALYAGLLDEAPGTDPAGSGLARDAAWIAACYSGDDVVEILGRLENKADERARAAATTIRQKSPWSVVATLAALRQAEHLPTLDAVLDRDSALARRFVADSDLVEGVRAQLVDRDRAPHWRHARVEDVRPADAAALTAAWS
jgi:enoyl-CoA hydratase